MKRLMKFMMSIAVAAISFVGCENNFEDVQKESNGFELTVVADNVSRTEYDATLQDIKWSAGDVAQVIVKGTYANCEANIDAADARIASFTWNPGTSISYVSAGTHIVQGYAPQKSYVSCEYDASGSARTCATRLGLKLPAEQTATSATFDKTADILVADNINVEITDDDLTAGEKSVGNFHFRRMVAVSEFTYNVTNSELVASDEKVNSVEFEVVSAANDKFLAGNMYIQPNADGAKYVDANLVEITDNKDYFYNNESNKVKVVLDDQPALKNGFKAWFVTSPVTLAATDKLIFTITTTAGTTITKTVDAVGKEVSFSTTKKNTLTVNLDNSVAIEAPVVSSDVWVKVTSVADVTPGTYVIVAKEYYCPNDTFGTNDQPNAVALKSANVSVVGDELSGIVADGMKWTFSGTVTAMTITKFGSSDELYATNTNNGVRVGTPESSLKWEITYDSGFYFTYPLTDARYLTMYNTQDWRCYKTSTDTQSSQTRALTLYKLQGGEGGGSIPTTPVLSVNAQPEEVAAAGANVTVALTVANLTENITVTPSETWITNATVSGSNLTFTVEANKTEKTRKATITLTSGDLTAIVNVSQAAATTGGGESGVSVTAEIDLTEQNYTNQQKLDDISVEVNGATVSFAKGTATTATQYYTSGTAVRIYNGATMTVAAPAGKNITKIIISGYKNAATSTFTPNVGTFIQNWGTSSASDGTWTGSSNSVVFTAGVTKHIRVAKVTVTYE